MTYEPDPEGEIADWLVSMGRSRRSAERGAGRLAFYAGPLRAERSTVPAPSGAPEDGISGLTNWWSPSHAPAWILGQGFYRLISTPARPVRR